MYASQLLHVCVVLFCYSLRSQTRKKRKLSLTQKEDVEQKYADVKVESGKCLFDLSWKSKTAVEENFHLLCIHHIQATARQMLTTNITSNSCVRLNRVAAHTKKLPGNDLSVRMNIRL